MNANVDNSSGTILLCGVIFAVIYAVLCYSIRENKGRSGVAGALLGIFLGVIGLIICLVESKDEVGIRTKQLRDGRSKECPFCRSLIDPRAVICPYCQTNLR